MSAPIIINPKKLREAVCPAVIKAETETTQKNVVTVFGLTFPAADTARTGL